MKEDIHAKKASNMKLSELKKRMEDIVRILESDGCDVIDQLIPLSEEFEAFECEANKRLGDLEAYRIKTNL